MENASSFRDMRYFSIMYGLVERKSDFVAFKAKGADRPENPDQRFCYLLSEKYC